MKRLVCVALFGLLLASCGDDGGEVIPQSGTWSRTEGAVTENTCNVEYTPDTGTFVLTVNGDGTFTIDLQDEYESFDCTLSGKTYSCPERYRDESDLAGQGLTAVLKIHVSIVGTFSSSTSATGDQTVRVDCEGSDCSLAASTLGTTFPCQILVPLTAIAQ